MMVKSVTEKYSVVPADLQKMDWKKMNPTPGSIRVEEEVITLPTMKSNIYA